MPRIVDYYCGVGGLSYGFARVYGHKEVIGFDWDKWCVANYRKNVSRNVYRVDIVKRKPIVPEVEIIIGGSPCEPFSQLNVTKTKYENHPLFNTLPTFFELIGIIAPTIFIHENVPNAKKYVNECIDRFNLGEEYNIEQFIISYSDYGVGTTRRRLFTIGVKRNKDFTPTNIIQELEAMKEKPKTLRDCVEKYVKMPKNPAINHVWRVSKRKKLVFYSFQVNLEWDKPLKGFGNPEKAWIFLPDINRTISVRELMSCMGYPESFRLLNITPLRKMYEMITDSVSPYFSYKLALAVRKYVSLS